MTKSTLSKSIIFGLIFSIFFGFISNFLYKKLTLQKNKVFYKKLYVVDIVEHEKTSNIGYVETINYTQFVSDHFFSTLNYILSIDKKTNQNAGCKKINVQKADLSIIIESDRYTENEKELINSCISELFSKSFKRFKKKIELVIEDQVNAKQFTINKIRKEIEKKILEEEATIANYEQHLCKEIDGLFKIVMTDVSEYIEKNTSENSQPDLPIFGSFQILYNFKRLLFECKKYVSFNTQIEELNRQIKEIRQAMSFTKIDELFSIKKQTVPSEETRERYLTHGQTLLTFSILGFIVGFILSANLITTLKKKKIKKKL